MRVRQYLIWSHIALLIAVFIILNVSPYILASTGDPGGAYVTTNPIITPIIIVCFLCNLALTMFLTCPHDKVPQLIRDRSYVSTGILVLLSVTFNLLMQGSTEFRDFITAINPSDTFGFILFLLLFHLLLVYSLTGMKLKKGTGMDKAVVFILLGVLYVTVYFAFVKQLSQSEWNMYFEELGGLG